MVNVTIYFHHGGDWVKHPEIVYEKGWVHCWDGYDPNLLFFIDLVNEYTSKLCFLSVQQLIVLEPSGEYFEIQGNRGIRTLLSFVSEDFHIIHLFATDDCELLADVLDIVMHSSSLLPVELVVVKSDRKILRYACGAEDCPFQLLISADDTTSGVSVKTLVDHIEPHLIAYDNNVIDSITIALYFKKKIQNDPKYKVKDMKADLHRVFDLNGLVDAVRNVLPEAHHRFCEFEDQLEEIKAVEEQAGQDLLDRYPPKTWCKAYLDTVCKNQVVDNNFTESFNGWILKARYMPIIEMLEEIRVKVMTRLAEKEAFVMQWKDDQFSPKSELLYNEFLNISQVCRVIGNGDNGYEVTEGENKYIVNLKEKRCTCRIWDLTGLPCPHAIKAMKHKKMKPKTEISKYYSKEITLQVDPSQAMEPPEMVKLVGIPKSERDRQKDEALKSSMPDLPDFEEDDEDLLMVRIESEQAYLQRRQTPQQLVGNRVISFRGGGRYGVSEPTNLPISPIGLTWKGKGAVTTNKLQAQRAEKLRTRRG
ncbi:putative DNA-directed RNA polymerase I subunit rpa1-like [Capsicum annuum]|nr:putative DNA-directed RNA polymerase I subunit rpa1-like [Capsicum annuum]KAF3671600.1 putative DNA-directed RNA polymerase I subunit rpa1-like [Capsicum annuum]